MALKEFEIEGINTNKSFLISVLQNKNFEEANFNTKFIENNLELGGEDERHDEIINQVFARGGNKSPNSTQEAA